MTAHCQRQVLGVHSKTIINDPDQRLAAGGRSNLDSPCAGVYRILDKFLHNTRGPLDDFTGSDLVDQGFWQLMDAHDLMFRDSGSSAMCVSQLKREKGSSATYPERTGPGVISLLLKNVSRPVRNWPFLRACFHRLGKLDFHVALRGVRTCKAPDSDRVARVATQVMAGNLNAVLATAHICR